MNWARGLKFACIHVAIAIPLIASEEIERWQTEKNHSQVHTNYIVFAAFQEDAGTISFSPCEIWRSFSWREKVLTASEIPAYFLSGWNEPCPASWTIAGLVGTDAKHHSLKQRLALDLGICCLITVQWILLGGLPLLKPRRWWLEPGAANTVLTPAVMVLCFAFSGLESTHLHPAESVAAVFGFVAFLALLLILSTWLAFLALIAQRLGRLGWHLSASSLRWARNR